MSIVKERRAIDAALDEYRSRLNTIPDEKFDVAPADGSWSVAQIYSHVLQFTLGSTIALERCAHGSCPPTNKGLTWEGRILLLLGRFPKAVKVPAGLDDKMPAVNITKEDARNLLIKCRRRIDTITPLIADASAGSRYKHPRLGMLNARQWFRFIRVHLQHHLKQVDRGTKEFNIVK